MPDAPAVRLPDEATTLMSAIAAAVEEGAKPWDVFAWRDKDVLFCEAKRRSNDRIQKSQLRWLSGALSLGLPLSSFLIVEWTMDEAN
jgi:hypothetical protein